MNTPRPSSRQLDETPTPRPKPPFKSLTELYPTHLPRAENGERLYFGYNVSVKWIMEYANQRLKPRRNNKQYGETTLMYRGLIMLQDHTGIHTLSYQDATKATDTNPPPERIVWEEDAIPILCICTSDPEELNLRPTRGQVNALTALFGGVQSPRWWTSI
ncbi:hypothetical protein BOTBODRAFT_59140 [Botryobasidium botryosum FD-172 SS1]|uniref:Uncharacterized protein n=1 Tax=Botryobasidium botryosum (strain FD-172 SS1) TaxID=930990 RepID=A0A067MB08_BOTB1|nr:hypothetical protein BOTBODRAFT_59140 [Botryobasidium botryosum FD-172 SS1]